jgi:hypothetical protein
VTSLRIDPGELSEAAYDDRSEIMKVEGGSVAENSMLGYYVRGETVFHMSAEPPFGQLVRRDGWWLPLTDGYYLWGKLLSGDVDTDGPFDDPPAGIPAAPALARL